MNKEHPADSKEPIALTSEQKEPLVRVHLLGHLRLDWQVPPAEPEAAWSSRTSARDLFLLLLLAPQRQASRSLLAGLMWPETEESNARESLRSALKVLRKVLCTAEGTYLIETVSRSDVLRLAEQERLWVDLDAFHYLVEQASQQREIRQALPLWEQARNLLCGELLEGEQTHEWTSCKWARLRRKQFHAARRHLIYHLATTYLQMEQPTQAEIVLSQHVTRFPTDQDALFLLMKLLLEQERFEEARSLYERCQRVLVDQERRPAKHLQELGTSLSMLAVTLSSQKRRSQHEYFTTRTRLVAEEDIDLPPMSLLEGPGQQPLTQRTPGQPESTPVPSMSLDQAFPLSELERLMQSRRQLLQHLFQTACASLILSPYLQLRPAHWERLRSTIHHPSTLDRATVNDLAAITRGYWRLSANSSLPLLNGVSGHFQDLSHLLQEGYPTPLQHTLCTLASETAQILGKILFDLHEYDLAWAYYSLSLRAAEIAHNADLWAVGMGRMALLLVASEQLQEALVVLQDAHHSPVENQLIRCWLSLIEAEAYAHHQNADASLQALTRAKAISAHALREEDRYATGFNRSRLASYEGSCYLRLEQPDRALPALQRALDLLDSSAIRSRSRLLTYMSEAYAQQRDLERVEIYAGQALSLTARIGSLNILQLVQSVRDHLEPWEETSSVQALERQLLDTRAIIMNVKEMS